MICILAISNVSRFQLVSVAEHAGLNLTWSKIPKDRFLRDVALLMSFVYLSIKRRPLKAYFKAYFDYLDQGL